MLLTNRRHRLLFMSLAAMEVAWFLPFALTAFVRMQITSSPTEQIALPALLVRSGAWSPVIFFLLCWATFLVYLLGTDLLNRRLIGFPLREVTMIGLMVITFLITARLFLFPTLALFDLSWLGAVAVAIFDQGPGSAVVFFLLLVNLFLWLRVAMSTDRSLTFLSVGVSFRLGLLLALLGNSLLSLAGGQSPFQALLYLWIFFCFGLLAVALARMDEKAFQATQSSGSTLPWPRLLQLIIMTLGTIGLAAYVSTIYQPTAIRALLGWFAPLWRFLGAIALQIFSLLFWFLTPLLEWLSEAMRAMFANLEPAQMDEQTYGEMDIASNQMDFAQLLRDYSLLRYGLILTVLLVVLFVIALFVARVRERERAVEQEESSTEGLALGGNPFQRLRDLAGLFRRYGLRPGLLSAISVQNIYANVSRLAARHGYPRGAAQPPDEYLPTLQMVFPGHEAALSRLTRVYMSVHYGDRPVSQEELTALRQSYTELHEDSRKRGQLQRVA